MRRAPLFLSLQLAPELVEQKFPFFPPPVCGGDPLSGSDETDVGIKPWKTFTSRGEVGAPGRQPVVLENGKVPEVCRTLYQCVRAILTDWRCCAFCFPF